MDERRLAVALTEFARTLTTDFSTQEFLDKVVEHAVQVVGVRGAGILLMVDETHHRFVASTDDVIRSIESVQLDMGEGPCLLAYTSGKHVEVPDLRADTLFASFSPRAVAQGMGAVYSFPLKVEDRMLGVLELWSDHPLQLSAADMDGARVLADVATAYLFNADVRAASDSAVEEMSAKAKRDPLTDLPNRAELQSRLDGVMTRSRESYTFAGLLFVDVDHFKQVNDTYGHQVGDKVLLELVHRVRALVPRSGFFARLSGDEFVLLVEGLSDLAQAEQLAASILAALEAPFQADEHQLDVQVSIGIAFAGHLREVPDAALVHADAAMYRAKAQGGGRFVTSSTKPPVHTDPRKPVRRDLAAGIGAGELFLVYQPILDARTQDPVGVEALLRWNHQQLGALAPLEIVSAAQRVGLTMPLLRWVVGQVGRDVQRWDARLGPSAPAFVGVNLAFRELMHPDVVPLVDEVLAETGLAANRVSLEITEDVFLSDDTKAAQNLGKLHERGLGVALDGFGDGFSSLVDLKRLPVSAVKIGLSFVSGVADSPVDQAIVSAVVQLSSVLGLTVTAEGVETVAQYTCVRDLGCDQVQGLLHAPPMIAADLELLLDPQRVQDPTGVPAVPA